MDETELTLIDLNDRLRAMRRAFIAAAMSFWMLGAVRGAILLGNFPTNGDSPTLSTTIGVGSTKAAVFTLGSTNYTIDNVVLRLENYNTIGGDFATLGFFLDNGSGTNVGAQVGNYLTSPVSASDTAGFFTFVPGTAVNLTANTKYWLRLSSGSGVFTWDTSNTNITPTGTGATLNSMQNSSDNGNNWTGTGNFNSFQINATPVPEPASVAILAAGGLVVVAQRRRVA